MNAEKRSEIEAKLAFVRKEFDEVDMMIGAEYGVLKFAKEMQDIDDAFRNIMSQLNPPATKPTFKPGSGIVFKRKEVKQ